MVSGIWAQDINSNIENVQITSDGTYDFYKDDSSNRQVARPGQRYAEKVDLEAILRERNENRFRSTSFVVTKIEDTDDGVCDGDCSLREAVHASNTTSGRDTIRFSSLFDNPQTIVLSLGQIEFGGPGGTGGNHVVIGPGEDLLTIDAQKSSRIFYMGFAHMLLELSDMTLANGDSESSEPYPNWGGAILNLGVNSTDYDIKMTNVTIKNSETRWGGAMSALRSHWLFENVTFEGNFADQWGAAFESEGGLIDMNNCSFINNTGRDAIKLFASNFVGLDVTLNMNNCTMSGNVSNQNTSAILATGQGANTSYAYINNSTITENTSNASAVRFDGLAVIEAQNSIISGNTGGTSPDIDNGTLESTSSYNLIGIGGGLTDGVDGNIVGVTDPGLDALTNNGGTTPYHHPISNTASPAYNAGNGPDYFSTLYDGDILEPNDQIGNERGAYGADDIGAVELQVDLQLNLKAFLQGPTSDPFSGEESLMRDDLRVSGDIPTTSPYSDALTCDATVFDVTGDDAIVDWVLVELRDVVDNSIVLNSRSGLIQRDGDIVDVDGVTTTFLMEDIAPGDYFIVVNHRSHLGLLSASTQSITDLSPTTLDFSSDTTVIDGGSNSVVDMGNGIYAMITGDYDGNGQIQSIDLNSVIPLLGEAGYSEADLDMNGQVQTTDINLMLIPNLGKGQSY
ncbi:MAG: hypothetical protein Aureis2KO_25550 [Aureisphaera sp.]